MNLGLESDQPKVCSAAARLPQHGGSLPEPGVLIYKAMTAETPASRGCEA